MLPALSRCWAPWSRRPLPPLLVLARGRKSRHDPPAKSKAGRVKVPPPVDPAELLVVCERYRQYRLVLQALRAEFKQEVLWQHRERVDKEKQVVAMEEHQRLMTWNNAENERLRKKREERLRREEEELQERKLQGAVTHAMLKEGFLKQKEREVLQLQEEAKNFITPENLDKRIEECLDNPRSYNFAIDKEGRIVKRTVLS